MTVCPNCRHLNPDSASQCEACYTPLLARVTCPSCGASLPLAARFCGCGVAVFPPSPAEGLTPTEPDLQPSESLAPEASSVPMTQAPVSDTTHLQEAVQRLWHVQTETWVDLPQLDSIRVGKPNPRVPPDLDVAGFPHAEIVSRIHATIRVETGIYYIEDVGSSNGTYVNNLPLPPGNRHRLRPGDRIALGKEDKVSFIFHPIGSS